MNKLDAAVMQMANKAAQGDIRSQREFINLVRFSEDAANSGAAPLSPHEMDQNVIQSILRRMQETEGTTTPISPESQGKESQ
jgi:hypothetical protein